MTPQNTQNLIGFLLKKSLFKDQNKTKPISNTQTGLVQNQPKRPIISKIKDHSKSQISELNVFTSSSSKGTFKKGSSQIQRQFAKTGENKLGEGRVQTRFKKLGNSEIDLFSHVKQSQKQTNPQNLKHQNQPNLGNIFLGFKQPKQQKKTFQSLQSDSSKCLDKLAFRLNLQIQNLNQKMSHFNDWMLEFLNDQIQSVKTKIISMVDEAFKQSDKSIKLCLKQQQSSVLNQMVTIKSQLQSELSKIQRMKVTIKNNEWRKTAAEMIASDLQNCIDLLIEKSLRIILQPPNIQETVKSLHFQQISRALKEFSHVQTWVK